MKGLSPLIAVVLLIAFVVAVGGLITVWLNTLTNTQTQTVSASSDAVTKCASTSLAVEEVRYTSGVNLVNVTFSSSGSENIKNITVSITGDGAITNSYVLFNGSAENFSPGLLYAISINTSGGATVPPELVSVSGLCQSTHIVSGSCSEDDTCMQPA